MLLKNVPSPTSFQMLKTHRGVLYPTFKDAARARGLLRSGEQLQSILNEAFAMSTSLRVCETFASLLLFAEVPDPPQMFRRNLRQFTDDLPPDSPRNVRIGVAAWRINQVLQAHGAHIQFYIPGVQPQEFEPPDLPVDDNANADTLLYQQSIHNRFVLDLHQLKVYHKFFDAIQRTRRQPQGTHQRQFFVDAPAGYGKTMLNNSILGTCFDGMVNPHRTMRAGQRRRPPRARIRPVRIAAVATTNQAAQLLLHGETAHSKFRIPLVLSGNEDEFFPIHPNSDDARYIRALESMIFDECPATHRHLLQALDRTLRYIRGNNLPWGGLIVLFSGDFRQILPIVEGQTPAHSINASFKFSPLWEGIRTLRLRINHRARNRRWQNFLLRLGNGHPSGNQSHYLVSLGRHCTVTTTIEGVVRRIYGDVLRQQALPPPELLHEYYAERLILAPKHIVVDAVNDFITNAFLGHEYRFRARERLMEVSRRVPQESLASLNPGNMGPHLLRIKVGMPLILIRTINKHAGLVTGVRCIVLQCTPNVLRVRLLTGRGAGSEHCLYQNWYNNASSTARSGVRFERFQFPVKPAFVCTIDRSQGMTLEHVGLLLRQKQVFAHGQLYTAVSRAPDPVNIVVQLSPDNARARRTTNVVFPQVLRS